MGETPTGRSAKESRRMAQLVIPDSFAKGGVTSSPHILLDMAKKRNLTFAASAVSKVEGSPDAGTSWFDITSLGSTFTGGIVFKAMAFQAYRITFTGTLFVNAN